LIALLAPIIIERTQHMGPRGSCANAFAAKRCAGIGGADVSIVRVGLAETKGFSDGYDAIFGGKKQASEAKPKAKKKSAIRKASARKKKK
jgi:hypothetical protein